MTISRRDFLIEGSIFTAALALTACERNKSEAYKAYLDHVKTRGIRLDTTGEILHYNEFSETDFESLNASINSRILSVNKEPPLTDLTILDQNLAGRFNTILELTNASVQTQFERLNHQITIYTNPENTDLFVDQNATNSLIDWVVGTPQLDSVIFKGEIKQQILVHNFLMNPLYPVTPKSSTATAITKEGLKLALTVINLNSQRKKFDGPDNGLVTELMQARLNAGGLKQEQWASSVALAYEYAVLGN